MKKRLGDGFEIEGGVKLEEGGGVNCKKNGKVVEGYLFQGILDTW